jgi:hypothetical protein
MKAKANIATPIPPEALIQETVSFDDAANRFCVKSNSAVICFCSSVADCSLLVECGVANKSCNYLNIKLM